MNLNEVRKSFAGTQRGHGSERHSIKSLSRRLMLSRQTVRKMLASGELEFSAQYDNGRGCTYEFSSESLDNMRESVVEEVIQEIAARLKNLDCSEQEIVLTALHSLRAQEFDCRTEFARKNDDDDEEDDRELRKLLGGSAGALSGAAAGGRFVGGLPAQIAGAALGAAAGRSFGGSDNADDIAAAGIGAGLGYGVNRAVKSAGGYRAVAKSAAPAARAVRSRMVDAIRRAALRAARV